MSKFAQRVITLCAVMMQIILNIKGLAVKSYVEDEKIIELDVEGPAEITAGDILTDSDIEIVNPNHYLFHHC